MYQAMLTVSFALMSIFFLQSMEDEDTHPALMNFIAALGSQLAPRAAHLHAQEKYTFTLKKGEETSTITTSCVNNGGEKRFFSCVRDTKPGATPTILWSNNEQAFVAIKEFFLKSKMTEETKAD